MIRGLASAPGRADHGIQMISRKGFGHGSDRASYAVPSPTDVRLWKNSVCRRGERGDCRRGEGKIRLRG
eukprot:134702-Hanusia_phi.AAC.2